MPSSHDIRQQFIAYFRDKHDHTMVPSSPVVPHDDPTLLFTNAGMNQFKDVFLATGEREYSRAVNSQKCIRAGGKHNDLEDVGKDTYHHTFFEMLGNWSFGDYFKREAIAWAWDLLTNVWGLPADRLYATVFEGDSADNLPPDTEAEAIWKEVTSIDPSHISRWSKKDNFWEMGETGPCGPCSELHIDLTPDGSGASLVNRDDPRVIEIWNLVFIQFNRDRDGRLSQLPARHVDTGMGFERVTAVLQGKMSNYDTDIFSPIFEAIHEVTGARPYRSTMDDPIDIAYRVLADHVRCLTFALADGATPGNEGRGYVLRRILRRGVRHGWQTLGVKEPFLCRLVPSVVNAMGDVFPELKQKQDDVIGLIHDEEESFGRTLDRGIALFDEAARRAEADTIPGEDAFRLHDTYGFPLDLTQVMAEERGMRVDVEAFDRLMDAARQMARDAGGGAVSGEALVDIVQRDKPQATEFVGYDGETRITVSSPVTIYMVHGHTFERKTTLAPGEEAAIVVNRTPFYAEAGGQVGDTGAITLPGGAVFRVTDTQRVGGVWFHLGVAEDGAIDASTEPIELRLEVDRPRREKIMANHTATHVMNRAMRLHVGPNVDQRGSLVNDQRLRFDFSHDKALTPEQVGKIEQAVNDDIAADLPVYAGEAPQEVGRSIHGLRAVFAEKYPPRVRVVSIGVPVDDLIANPGNEAWSGYSIEFCGGTHLARTGDAEGFVLVGEEAVAKGIRRVTALTGAAAQAASARAEMLLRRAEALRSAPADHLASSVAELTQELGDQPLPMLQRQRLQGVIADLQKTVKAHEKQRHEEASGDVVTTARAIAEAMSGEVIVSEVEGADARTLRTAMDVIRQKHPDSAVLLGAADDGKVAFIASVPKPLIERGLKAGDWIREVAKAAGGGGGGRPDMAQAGGKDPAKLPDALRTATEFASSRL